MTRREECPLSRDPYPKVIHDADILQRVYPNENSLPGESISVLMADTPTGENAIGLPSTP